LLHLALLVASAQIGSSSEAVVIVTRRIGMEETRALDLASEVSFRLARVGWRFPVSPPAAAARLKLLGVDSASCEGRLDCVGELGRAFGGGVVIGLQLGRVGSGTAVELTALAAGAKDAAATKSFLLRDASGLAALDEPVAEFGLRAKDALRATRPAIVGPVASAEESTGALPAGAKAVAATKPVLTREVGGIAASNEPPASAVAAAAPPSAPPPAATVSKDAGLSADATQSATPAAETFNHFALMLRVGGSAISVGNSTDQILSLGAALELDFYVVRPVAIFVDVGLGLSFGQGIKAAANPGSLGVKYIFRTSEPLRPHTGLGFGFAGVQSLQGWSWLGSLELILGLAYYPLPNLGIGAELRGKLGTNLQAIAGGVSLDVAVSLQF
jgi:hypothetical protein